VETYISTSLDKGIPSLFTDLKSLYVDPSKRDVIEAVVESHRESSKSAASSSTNTDPTVYLWTLYFLAQHYSFLKQYQKAISLLEEAIAHTPTLPELYTCRARVLKRAGDPYGAARSLEEARLLDGQDRFLNTKSGKYRLRAGLIEEAVEIFGMFTRVGFTLTRNDYMLAKS
jgi:N-alpha-acetyltransferase 15/16, NatA auxiliary subunit